MQEQYITVPLINRNLNPPAVALIDPDDADLILGIRWQAQKNGRYYYATAKIDGHRIWMHRLILGVTDPKVIVDHINRDPLDNRRENLRIADRMRNAWNAGPRRGTSKFKGVSYFRKDKTWRVTISVNRKCIHIGFFKDEVEAAHAYDKAAKEYHGEFAYLNFPD